MTGMVSAPSPMAQLNPLDGADGSAKYTAHGYTIIAAVNGPIQVMRRDELPEEAVVEINVRPAVGVGTPRTRQLESILQSTLRQIILTRAHPRTLIQMTVQILQTPSLSSHTLKGLPELYLNSYLLLLSPVLTTSLLALLSAKIPLRTTLNPVLVLTSRGPRSRASRSNKSTAPRPRAKINTFVLSSLGARTPGDGDGDGGAVWEYTPLTTALHIFVFSGEGEMLFNQTEGNLPPREWDVAFERAKDAAATLKSLGAGGNASLNQEEEQSKEDEMRADTENVMRKDGGGRAWLLDIIEQERGGVDVAG